LKLIERVMLAEGQDGDDIGHHVEQEVPKLLTRVTTGGFCGILAAVSWLKIRKLYQAFCGSPLTTSVRQRADAES